MTRHERDRLQRAVRWLSSASKSRPMATCVAMAKIELEVLLDADRKLVERVHEDAHSSL